ncbi:aminomethyltransferase [Cryobacterium mesophilum]|uniref:Aminomethyltransferase n=1 Tax=Terrimesophilobacter mesophilus TaxID=433647 RepID=A0A4R8VCE5_9MICO|nr:glycine cleavage system aminomethyltransferase GcvT [Terrimesophilobacter mesophilus]MBB5633814.1 aminomethyltransferase [Terrimesophilobacter mesophilus]TFB80493.1 glycine cleavage system aminomethyltransferase GcvT [Terrimesophilobacter mesophilus]
MSDSPTSERFSPLHRLHVDGGASFTDFAGWQMPVSYGSDLGEHHAVRTAAGIFDISHMAEISVHGPDAAAFLDYALAGKMSTIALMQAKYSLLLDDRAGIIDDLIVYHNADGEYLVVANAGNHDVVLAELAARAKGFDVTVTDRSDATALIAVQGPRAVEILQATAGLAVMDGQQAFDDLRYYWSTGATFGTGTVFVARTGYTGEDGFELYVDTADAEPLWRALLAAGEPLGLIPAGLASRDTLRLEAGMPLYGHELSRDILPAQAGLGRVVHFTKEGDFVGRAAAEAGPPEGARVLVGLASEGRRAGRAGYAVLSGDATVGEITSGALSPTLGHPIAMAFVDPGFSEPGTVLDLDVRGSRIPATVTALPFYKREKN